MSQEVKVQYGHVENAISKIDSASQSFETTLLKNMAAGNELEVVNKLNELNTQLEEVCKAYKEILKTNNLSVRTTLQDLKAVDHQLSASIKAL